MVTTTIYLQAMICSLCASLIGFAAACAVVGPENDKPSEETTVARPH